MTRYRQHARTQSRETLRLVLTGAGYLAVAALGLLGLWAGLVLVIVVAS